MLTIFASLALALAAVGIYGVTAHAVSVRTREMGIRTALGATPGELQRLILLEGLRLVAMGIAFGAAAGMALTRVLQSQLFEVSAVSPRVFIVAGLFLGLIGLAACYFPAKRAADVDPIAALRAE